MPCAYPPHYFGGMTPLLAWVRALCLLLGCARACHLVQAQPTNQAAGNKPVVVNNRFAAVWTAPDGQVGNSSLARLLALSLSLCPTTHTRFKIFFANTNSCKICGLCFASCHIDAAVLRRELTTGWLLGAPLHETPVSPAKPPNLPNLCHLPNLPAASEHLCIPKPRGNLLHLLPAQIFDLTEVFHEEIRVVLQDDSAEMSIAFGTPLKCGTGTNPRHVAICLKSATDGAPIILGQKTKVTYTSMATENMDGGFRLSFTSVHGDILNGGKLAVAHVDFLCSEQPEYGEYGEDEPEIFTAAAHTITEPYLLYEISIHGPIGCPQSADLFDTGAEGGDAEEDGLGDGANEAEHIDWTSANGKRKFRFKLSTLSIAPTMADLEGSASDLVELSLGPKIACGDGASADIAVCWHAANTKPVTVAFRSMMSIWRARPTGMALQFTGDVCEDNGRPYITWLKMTCSRDDAVNVVARQEDPCTFVIEAHLRDGCAEVMKNAEVIEKRGDLEEGPAGVHRRKRAMAPVGEPGVASRDRPRQWGPDTRSTGCVLGNCTYGFGLHLWRSGSRYNGTWVHGKRQGFGRHAWLDGRAYTGRWLEDKRAGHGTHTYASQDSYTGNWSNDLKSGRGVYTWRDGRVYTGDFLIDQMHGYGVKVWPDGRKYKGSFVGNHEQGNGAMSYPDGSKVSILGPRLSRSVLSWT